VEDSRKSCFSQVFNDIPDSRLGIGISLVSIFNSVKVRACNNGNLLGFRRLLGVQLGHFQLLLPL
jgi:hypothetical protein